MKVADLIMKENVWSSKKPRTALLASSFLSILLSLVSASAPGDVDSFCTDTLLNSSEFSFPIYPPNARILMDSYNYLNLLPPHSGAAWQQVDNDDNNDEGTSSSWSQSSNIPCRQAVVVCGSRLGPQDNWLITQYIYKIGTDLHASVFIEFQLGDCTSSTCQRTFSLYLYETNVQRDTSARDTDRYQLINMVSIDGTEGTRQNWTSEIEFETDSDGFYLSIRDSTTCVTVTRISVYYTVCPGRTEALLLVIRPETPAPSTEHAPREVTVECIPGASPENGTAAKLNCNQGGVWSPISGSGCRCDPGNIVTEDGQSCTDTGCPVDMYLFNESCQVCPNSSVGLLPDSAACASCADVGECLLSPSGGDSHDQMLSEVITMISSLVVIMVFTHSLACQQ